MSIYKNMYENKYEFCSTRWKKWQHADTKCTAYCNSTFSSWAIIIKHIAINSVEYKQTPDNYRVYNAKNINRSTSGLLDLHSQQHPLKYETRPRTDLISLTPQYAWRSFVLSIIHYESPTTFQSSLKAQRVEPDDLSSTRGTYAILMGTLRLYTAF